MSWSERYSNKEYEAFRNEYIQRFVRPGLKNTPEARKFYKDKVLSRKPKNIEPTVEQPRGPEQLEFDIDDSKNGKGMSWEKAMKNPHFDGKDWMAGTTGPEIV